MDATIAAARTQNHPTSIRLAALGVMVTYYRADLYAVFPATPTSAGQRPRDYVQIGHWVDPVSYPGSQPLVPSAARQKILAVMQELMTGDPDTRVRMAAAYLAEFLPTAK